AGQVNVYGSLTPLRNEINDLGSSLVDESSAAYRAGREAGQAIKIGIAIGAVIIAAAAFPALLLTAVRSLTLMQGAGMLVGAGYNFTSAYLQAAADGQVSAAEWRGIGLATIMGGVFGGLAPYAAFGQALGGATGFWVGYRRSGGNIDAALRGMQWG